MLTKIHADYTVSITDLKKNPQALIDDAHGEAIGLSGCHKGIVLARQFLPEVSEVPPVADDGLLVTEGPRHPCALEGNDLGMGKVDSLIDIEVRMRL